MAKYYTNGSNALAPDYEEGDSSASRPNFHVINGGKSSPNPSTSASQSVTNSSNPKDSQNTQSGLHVVNDEKPSNSIAPRNSHPNLRAVDSRNNLLDAEKNALSNTQPSFYRGTGKSTNSKQKGFFAQRKKGLAGLILTLTLLVGGGAFLGSTNSLLAPALNEVVTEVTDIQHYANTIRSVRLTKNTLNGTVETNPWTGTKKYSLSKTTEKNLARNGIEVEGRGKKYVLIYGDKTIPADEFLDFYKNNVEFRDAYNRARRGRIMGFFDNTADKIYKKLGVSRNSYKDYQQTSDAEADRKKFRETMTDELANDTDNVNSKTNKLSEETEYETDADGNRVPKTDENGNPIVKKVNDESTISTKNTTGDNANTKARSYISDVAGKVQQVTSWGCTVMQVLNSISIAIAANEIQQSISYFMGLAENPSKMQMGLGAESAINSMLEFMTTAAEAEVENYEDTPTITGSIENENLEVTLASKIKTNKAPIEAPAMQSIMTNAPLNAKSGKNYSLERTLTSLAGAIGTTAATFQTCAIAQATGAAVSSVVTIASAIATGGASLVASFTWKAVGTTILSISAASFLSFMAPTVAKAFFTNAFENAVGLTAGQLYAQGAVAANTRIARTGSGQSPSSEAALNTYLKLNDEVIALDAEVDRNRRSPFDLTSRNTFLGSIAYNFAVSSSSSKFIGKVKNLMRTTSSSISSIVGNKTMAASNKNTYFGTYGDCPRLESIGAKGDTFCNPITTSDATVLDLMPDDPLYISKLNPGLTYNDDGSSKSDNLECDVEGNCTIVKNSNLAKFVTYCAGRESPFGVADATILGTLKVGSTVSNILGATPIGDAFDILDAAQDINNMEWATGQKCVNNSETNPDWDKEYKYYQLYVQDQRLLEQMGNYEGGKSSVTAYIEEYEAEHPLDNSPSGYLARISGLSKDNAQLVLDIAYYYNFLENYDPNSRIAMNGAASDTPEMETVIASLDQEFHSQSFAKHFASDQNTADLAIIAEHAIYADVRNRNYAV